MISSSHPEPARPRLARPGVRGFTLVELLVVIGMIIALIAILLPAVNSAYNQATRTSMMGDLQVLAQGLDAYKNDFGDYPRTGLGASPGSTTINQQVTGAETLCWALLAPGPAEQDGFGDPSNSSLTVCGPGFRIHGTQGKVYSYIAPDRLKVGTVSGGSNIVNAPANANAFDDTKDVFADRYGNVILYYPANLSVVPTTKFVGAYTIGTVPPQATYNYNDNSIYTGSMKQGTTELSQKVFEYRLGNISMTGTAASTETPILVPYLLWCAGPDGQFGPQLGPSGGSMVTTPTDDDVIYPDQVGASPAGITTP
jgi:type II secretory pathway pseudopilin PulG